MAERVYELEEPLWIGSLEHVIPSELAGIIIGRYFTLSGFLNMLKTSELCFKKISIFEDKAEGLPLYRDTALSLQQSKRNVDEAYEFRRKESIIRTVENYYASCWTISDHESYLMWKNYASFYEGILVLTTVNQLLASLILHSYEEISDAPSIGTGKIVTCFFGKVDYGYKEEFGSDHKKAFGKSIYFRDENEFRIVIYHHPIIEDNEWRCAIKNFSFIKKIVCSPKSTTEFIDLVRKITMDYSLSELLVQESEIKQDSRNIFDGYIKKEILD